MKSYYFYSQDDNDKWLKETIEFLDSLEKDKPAQIYINSWGGSCWLFETILKRLNEMVEEWYNITIRIIFIGSAWFDLAYFFKGKKILEEWADAVIHITATTIDMWGNTYRSNDSVERDRKKWRDKQPQNEYPFLTPKERKEYLSWKDIWISPDRMKDIFCQVKKQEKTCKEKRNK